MNLLRRILGTSSDNSVRNRSSRRASHVTPSATRPEAPAPVAEAVEAAETETVLEQEDITTEITENDSPEPVETLDAETAEQVQEEIARPAPIRKAPKRDPRPAPVPTKTKQLSKQAMTYGIASDVGKLRDNNEDSCFAMQWHSISVDDRPDFGFFAVADGMGGHLDGERASGIAVQTLAAEMLESIYVPMLRDFKTGDSPTIMDALVAAAEKANIAVINGVPGGGTTLSTVAVVGNLAYLVHVGDSRVYLIHDDQIEQLTTDHTLVQRLIEMQELTPEEAEYYPQKNVLYRAIGQNEKLKIERLIRTMPPASNMLICSDGLWDLVDDGTLKRVTVESSTPQEACDRLVKLANEQGGTDNISVIIFRIPDDRTSA